MTLNGYILSFIILFTFFIICFHLLKMYESATTPFTAMLMTHDYTLGIDFVTLKAVGCSKIRV